MDLYCDESGYTGRNLLSKDQPYFVYSAVKLDKNDINDIFKIVCDYYDLQSGEIKGNRIVKSSNGRKAIKKVFDNYSKNVRLVFHDKKYALAGKIIEAGVEPYLKSNYHFYDSGLNRFIASGLYTFFLSKDESAENLFYEFEEISKGKIALKDSSIGKESSNNPYVNWLSNLIATDLDIFKSELESNGLNDKLTLDLTTTSLFGLLSEWGKREDSMKVICDDSKAFLDNPVFDMLQSLGSNGKRANILNGEIGFKLQENIEYKDSKMEKGLQIADLFSSTVFSCLKNKNSTFSKEILSTVYSDSICSPISFCILPELNIEELEKNSSYYHRFMNYILWEAKKRL